MRKQKTIRLGKKSPLVVERTNLINKVIKVVLNESFESQIETDYEMVDEGKIIIYRFNTNSGNSYDLEFIYSPLLVKHEKLTNGSMLGDYVTKENTIAMDIAFVPSEINMDDRENHELYTKETGRDEVFELMGRISYLVKVFIKNNPNVDIFVIGKNTKDMKLKIYNKMYDNIFSNEYLRLEGVDGGYDEGCFYFIKK